MNWDYIAGFFDGEGNVHIHPIRGPKGPKAYHLLVRIYSTNKEVLGKIWEFLGNRGNIYIKKFTIDNIDRNLLYELTITKKEDCLFILRNIVDYCIIKKDQVDYLLKNFSFLRGNNNLSFDLDKFRSFNTRKNVNKFTKNYTITAHTE